MTIPDLPMLAELADVLSVRRRRHDAPPWVLLGSGLGERVPDVLLPLARSATARGETAPRRPTPSDLAARTVEFWDRDPSLAEAYLAELVREGYLGTIADFGWSNSYERALVRVVPPGRYLRLVRGEHDPRYLLRAMEMATPAARIIKLMGDIVGESANDIIDEEMSLDLRHKIIEQIDRCGALVIGALPQTTDVATILSSCRGPVWLLGDAEPPATIRDLRQVGRGSQRPVEDLCLLLANDDLRALERENRRRMNAQIRSRQPIDASYSDRLIQRLAHDIRDACHDWADPTLLVFVHDPAAPGGSEVEKRIRRYLSSIDGNGPDFAQVTVRGSAIRWMDRHAEDMSSASLEKGSYVRAVIIDSVSFSGRTLKLATGSVQQLFPGIDVFWAALVVSKALADSLEDAGIRQDHLLSVFISDRHDIFFPWGWTQATSSVVRHVPAHRGEHAVQVNQRPWGTIEVLANSDASSVRLKTIRAGGKTSYQRHALRDEFFVVLDDSLGVEFDSEDGEVVEAALLAKGDYLAVPRGVRYRLAAYRDSVRVLEVAFGLYDQVFDVERFADEYGRVGKLGDI